MTVADLRVGNGLHLNCMIPYAVGFSKYKGSLAVPTFSRRQDMHAMRY